MVVVVVGIVVVVVEVVGGLVEVVVAGGRVLVEDVLSGSIGGAGWLVEQPATPSMSAIHAPAIAMVRGAAPVLIPVGRVVVELPSNPQPTVPFHRTGVRPSTCWWSARPDRSARRVFPSGLCQWLFGRSDLRQSID